MKYTLITILACQLMFAGKVAAQTDTTTTRTTTTTTTVKTDTLVKDTVPKVAVTSAPKPATADSSNLVFEELQRVYFGARYMPTFTSFDVKTYGDGVAKTSFTMGHGVGGYIGVNLSRNVGLQLEGIYSQLSQKYTHNNQESTVNLDYLNFPLMLVLNTDVRRIVNLNITAGPQIGINIGSEVSSNSSNNVDTVKAVVAAKPMDFGVAYGAGLDIRLSPVLTFDFGFRGVLGLLDISDDSRTATTKEYLVLDRSYVRTFAGYVGLRLNF